MNNGMSNLGAALPQFDEIVLQASEPEVKAGRAEVSQENVREIPLEIDVVIGRAKVSVASLMKASEGDRFRLDRNFGEPVELQVNGRVFGYGEIVADEHENIIGIKIVSVDQKR